MVAATEIDLRLFGMLVALAAIWIGFGIVTGGKILNPASIVTLSVQTTVVAIMATGMVLVIVSRNIDLSVGSMVGVIAMAYALLMTDWLPNILGIAARQPADVDPGAGHRAVAGRRASARSRASSSPTSACPRSSSRWAGCCRCVASSGLMSSGAAISGIDATFQHFGGGATGSIGGTLTWALAADRLHRRRRPAGQQSAAASSVRLPGPPDLG